MTIVSSTKSLHCQTCPTRQAGCFACLPTSLLPSFDAIRTDHLYQRGQVLFYEGNPAVGVYCVHSGRLKLTKSGAGGRRQILALPGPGDLLGTPAVIADRSHDVTAEVLEESRVCFIEKRPFTERLDAHPPLFRDVVRRLIQGMEGLENRLVDQVDKPVHARLARLLRGLGESLGRAGPKGLHLDLPLSREELSEMIGTTPETTIRLLGEFRKRKLVRLEGRGIVLLDLAGLRREENDG